MTERYVPCGSRVVLCRIKKMTNCGSWRPFRFTGIGTYYELYALRTSSFYWLLDCPMQLKLFNARKGFNSIRVFNVDFFFHWNLSLFRGEGTVPPPATYLTLCHYGKQFGDTFFAPFSGLNATLSELWARRLTKFFAFYSFRWPYFVEIGMRSKPIKFGVALFFQTKWFGSFWRLLLKVQAASEALADDLAFCWFSIKSVFVSANGWPADWKLILVLFWILCSSQQSIGLFWQFTV